MKKGGVAKGELVLAIFELANCFRMGWGVKKDPAAARQYYETAANLGDTDAMDQVAWCYLEGFGGKKDKVRMRHDERNENYNRADPCGTIVQGSQILSTCRGEWESYRWKLLVCCRQVHLNSILRTMPC